MSRVLPSDYPLTSAPNDPGFSLNPPFPLRPCAKPFRRFDPGGMHWLAGGGCAYSCPHFALGKARAAPIRDPDARFRHTLTRGASLSPALDGSPRFFF